MSRSTLPLLYSHALAIASVRTQAWMIIFARTLTSTQHAPKCERASPRADLRIKHMAPRPGSAAMYTYSAWHVHGPMRTNVSAHVPGRAIARA
eukprot:6174271-Pleurochrysis_carterae.AAC.2